MGTFHKRMTSILSAAVITLSAGSMTSAATLPAEPLMEGPGALPIKAELKEEKQAQFHAVAGIIESISAHGTDGTMKKIAIEVGEDQEIHLIVSEDTYFIDDKELEEGLEIVAFYDAFKPVILIYPPQYHAEAIAVVEEGRNLKADRFDKDLVSYDGTLKLNVSEESEVVLEDGTPYDGELAERKLVVSYDVSTRSIPAQTTPNKIIVLLEEETVEQAPEGESSELSHEEELNEQPANSVFETPAESVDGATPILESVEALETEEGHTLVPLREVAEKLGYLVFWRATDQTVLLGQDISIQAGERTVHKQSEQFELESAAVVIDGMTYVPASFFEKIK